MWRWFIGLLVGLPWFWAAPAWAQDLVLLRLAEDPAGRALEDAYVEELALVLETGSVVLADPETPGFRTLALGDQVEVVRPLLEQEGAVAVGWLDGRPIERVDLTLVFVSEDRAVARLLQAERDGEPLAELALATREVLRTLPPLAPVGPEVEPPVPRVEAPDTEPHQRILTGLVVEGDVPGVPGAAGRLGIGIRWSGGLVPRTEIEAGLALQIAPPTMVGERVVQAWAVTPGLAVQHWRGAWGPRLALDVPVHRVAIDDDRTWGAKVRLVPGLALRWQSVRIELGVGLAPLRHQVRDRETDEVVWDSGWVDGVLVICWSGNS